jgi:hypothetical protein
MLSKIIEEKFSIHALRRLRVLSQLLFQKYNKPCN